MAQGKLIFLSYRIKILRAPVTVPAPHQALFFTCTYKEGSWLVKKKDYFEMVKRIKENQIDVIMGPEVFTWLDGKEEYMIQFWDCNGFNLELKANSEDDTYILEDLGKWSHKA